MSAAEAETAEGVEPVDTATGEIHRPTVLMSEDEARIITADIKAWAGTLWQKLKQAHDGQAWRALGYGSWRDYIDTEFEMGKSQAYRLLTHANAVYEIAEAAGLEPEEVSPAGDTLSERVTRDLDIEAVIEAIRAAMAEIEPGAKATRQEITERIIKAMRAQNPKPAPKAKPPAEPEPDTRPLEDRLAEAMEREQAKGAPPAENEVSDEEPPPSSDEPQQDPAPAAAQDPGKAGAPESRAAATGSTGASSAGAGDGGGTGDVLPTPPAVTLPADWRDLIGHAAYIVRLDPALVAAAATDDDRADLQALTDWLSLVDEASDPAVLAEPQEQTA